MNDISLTRTSKTSMQQPYRQSLMMLGLLVAFALFFDLIELFTGHEQIRQGAWFFLDAATLGCILICLNSLTKSHNSNATTALVFGFSAAFMLMASHIASHVYQLFPPKIHTWILPVLYLQLTVYFFISDAVSRYPEYPKNYYKTYIFSLAGLFVTPIFLSLAVTSELISSDLIEFTLFGLLGLQFAGYMFSISSSRLKAPVSSGLVFIFLFLATLVQLIEIRIVQDFHMPGSLFLMLIAAVCFIQLRNQIVGLNKASLSQPDQSSVPTTIKKPGKNYKDELSIALQSASFLRAYAELSEERDLVTQANEDKSNFLAMMSHEIRTPMNAVIGTLQLISDTELDEDQNHLVKTAHQSANSMLMLLNNILDFSHLESGQLKLEETDFSLSEEIHGLISVYHEYAVRKNLSLKPVILNDSYLRSDIVRIRQIFGNLINNAIKFSEQGDIRIKAELHQTDEGIIHLTGSVSDQGIGMTEEEQTRLFQPFTQAHSGIASKFGGTGLGLSICRHLCEQMGGSIRVCSAPGIGSEFVFSIICKKPTQPSEALMPESGSPRQTNERLLNVLLAEDSNANREVISKILERAGHRVTGVADGRAAVQSAAIGDFDIILMDIQMPEMDGIEALKQIRQLPHQAGQIPIIALTANALQGDREKYMEQGMDGYLSKPVRAKDLFSVLSQIPQRS